MITSYRPTDPLYTQQWHLAQVGSLGMFGPDRTGKVKVRKADVHGESHDSITASEYLIIRSSGQIHGTASYGKIEIERGGLITGSVSPCGDSSAAKAVQDKSVRTDA